MARLTSQAVQRAKQRETVRYFVEEYPMHAPEWHKLAKKYKGRKLMEYALPSRGQAKALIEYIKGTERCWIEPFAKKAIDIQRKEFRQR